MENQLIKEMAFTLYERELTSMGIARRFAKMSKWAFIEGLAERGLTSTGGRKFPDHFKGGKF